MDGAQPAHRPQRAALVDLGVGERVQCHRGVAGPPGPAPQRDLLRHRPGREERGGLRAQQASDPFLQLGDDAVAVDVRGAVEIGDGPGPGRQRGQPLTEREVHGRPDQDPFGRGPGVDPAQPLRVLLIPLLLIPLLFLILR